MGYQRARWHSGLTYMQICEECKETVTYTDHALDYRPWYPDGYVDCPRCRTHLRHNEKYALGPDGKPQFTGEPEEASKEIASGDGFTAAFCHSCGTKFGEGHRFCAQCGTKRD